MTDKQIIIDGVDVSGCCQYMPRHMEDYDIDTLDYCKYHFKPCKDVDVKYCYYKQLKRKEQECEWLKKIIERLDVPKHEVIDMDIAMENEKLKKTLTDIKEIVEECYYKCNSMNNCNISCKYYNNCNGEYSYLLDCLNKQISEVLKDE